MNIGEKIKRLRIRHGLTQEELANRSELSKGFISQLERDLTSPSITTLVDILQCLGTNLQDFFNEREQEQIVFTRDDIFVKEDPRLGNTIQWLVPNAQKNAMEPILMILEPDGTSGADTPHEGEEFGYVLSGSVQVKLGDETYRVRRGECFNFKPTMMHEILNPGRASASLIWVSTPPSF